MCPQIATELAKFVVETRCSDIPQDVVDFTKGLMLKTVAGTLAGSATPSGRKMSHIIKSRNLGKDAGVIGCGFKTSL